MTILRRGLAAMIVAATAAAWAFTAVPAADATHCDLGHVYDGRSGMHCASQSGGMARTPIYCASFMGIVYC